MAIKVGMVSLGCAKNQVDGEMLMANLKNAGFELCDDAALADVAIVNTCGFIDSAKQESIDEILELATLKKEGRIKKIVVTGCLAERYREEIHKELPEVDGVFGIGANADIAACIESAMNDFTESFPEKSKMPLCGERELSTPSYFAYIKIAEGCDNKCTYCAIPMNRTGDRESLTALMKKIREKIPGVTLRTTLITGFPGETEEEFTELAEFVKDIEFERLGCFAYSQEEGTPAALLPDQIDDEVKNHRAEIIMESQMNIMDRLGEKQVGGDITVLTEGFDRYAECWFGRSAMDAPDIDGKVFFSAETKPYYGEMVTVHVDEAIDGDLFGTRV